jgi:hypothetical protein
MVMAVMMMMIKVSAGRRLSLALRKDEIWATGQILACPNGLTESGRGKPSWLEDLKQKKWG